MTRIWLFLIPIAAGVTSAAAQLTPEQRQQREWAAVANTIGRTREIEADDRAQHDPLRGLRCAGDPSQYYPCTTSAGRDRNGLPTRDPLRRGAPAPIHFGAFGDTPQGFGSVHALDQLPVALRADHPTTLTLTSTIGAPKRHLMVHTAVAIPGTEPTWTRTAEMVGDPQGRYLVPVPAIDPGSYELTVEIYDLDQPTAPFSASRTPLIVR